MGKQRFSEGPGPSQRQLRVGELVRRALSDALVRGDIHDPEFPNVPITVSEVRMSPDLRVATAFVSPLGGGDATAIKQALQRNRKELRHIVTKSVQLKYSPDLKFIEDTSFDQMDSTRALLQSDVVQQDIARAQDRDVDPTS